MKKTAAIFIILLLIFNINGGFIVFEWQRYITKKEIKKQIKSGVSDDKLHTFSFSFAEWEKLYWVENGKEFRLAGKMYDIVRAYNADGKIIVKCINDEEETSLFAGLDKMVEKQMGSSASQEESNRPLMKLFKLMSSLLYDKAEILPRSVPFLHNSVFFGELTCFYTHPYLKIIYPPPQVSSYMYVI